MRYKDRFAQNSSSDDGASIEDSLTSTPNEKIWNHFAEHIKRKRRFLPKPEEFEFVSNPSDWLPGILHATDSPAKPASSFYCATQDELGAPPPEKARRNRANASVGVSM
jgi:hypothetical protein